MPWWHQVAVYRCWSRAVYRLVAWRQDLSEELMCYACGALGNLARDNDVCKSEIAEAGGIEALIALAQRHRDQGGQW